jgi:hypothetical protein
MSYSSQTGVFFPPKVKRHLRPFYPYLEKHNNSTHALEYRAPEEPHPIKINTIKTWIQTCELTHENHCINPQAKEFGKPIWLIDVKGLCVVKAGEERYVALSYIWGNAECASLTIKTLEELQKPGSLDNVVLARTVRDAIELTRKLGCGYLWVDKLCIVQDDLGEKHAQILAMRAVYAGAYFTIVAAQGEDASEPLYSGDLVEDESEAICVQIQDRRDGDRQLFGVCDQQAEHVGEDELSSLDIQTNLTQLTGENFETTFSQNNGVIDELIGGMSWEDNPYSPSGDTPPNYSNTEQLQTALNQVSPATWQKLISDGIMQRLAVELTQTTWFSRGWTFQEYLFSPRRLVFHSNTINWDCHCASWHENQRHISSKIYHWEKRDNNFGMDMTSWPNMYRLIRLICLFNRRLLTRQEDVLDAFEGPLQSFRAVFEGGFIAGLPQMFFDAALLWQPYSPLLRREASGFETSTEVTLPSWSWVGWQGNLHSESWLAGFDYTSGMNNWSGAITTSSTVSTVKWFLSSSTTSSKTSIIVSADELRRRSLATTSEPLPEGWSDGSYGYYYESPKDYQPFGYSFRDGDQPFRYPVPIMNNKSQPALSIRASFIHGRTRSATLPISALLSDIPSVRHGCVTAALVHKDDLFAGYLRLNEDINNIKTRVGDTCELIELSSGESCSSDDGELDWEGGTTFRPIHSFFNIMWIEWKDSIAYRKAVGRIEKSVWEDIARKEVDIKLG